MLTSILKRKIRQKSLGPFIWNQPPVTYFQIWSGPVRFASIEVGKFTKFMSKIILPIRSGVIMENCKLFLAREENLCLYITKS